MDSGAEVTAGARARVAEPEAAEAVDYMRGRLRRIIEASTSALWLELGGYQVPDGFLGSICWECRREEPGLGCWVVARYYGEILCQGMAFAVVDLPSVDPTDPLVIEWRFALRAAQGALAFPSVAAPDVVRHLEEILQQFLEARVTELDRDIRGAVRGKSEESLRRVQDLRERREVAHEMLDVLKERQRTVRS